MHRHISGSNTMVKLICLQMKSLKKLFSILVHTFYNLKRREWGLDSFYFWLVTRLQPQETNNTSWIQSICRTLFSIFFIHYV